MTSLGTIIGRGVTGSRPAAGTPGALYFDTTRSVMQRDNGSTWDDVEGAGGLSNPMTTQDDIIVGGASGTPARLAKGTDGQVLTVDPTTHHLLWATPSGGSGAMTQISDPGALGSPAANITFSSISGSYNQLKIVLIGRSDAAGTSQELRVQFNADTGSNYAYENAYAGGGGTGQRAAGPTTFMTLGQISGSSATASYPGIIELIVPFYAGTTFFKQIQGQAAYSPDDTNGDSFLYNAMGVWASASAITSVKLFPGAGNFIAGSHAILYGIT